MGVAETGQSGEPGHARHPPMICRTVGPMTVSFRLCIIPPRSRWGEANPRSGEIVRIVGRTRATARDPTGAGADPMVAGRTGRDLGPSGRVTGSSPTATG